jgi:mannitol/fructose-specific phosphotransferase system IIA component (Ntr-type)/galactitol-specific phosphotransferase system IIB component
MQKGLYIKGSLPFSDVNSYGSVFIDNLYPIILDNFQIRECQLEKYSLKYLAQYFRYTSDTLEIFIENILETQTVVRKFIESVSMDLNLPIYRDYELFENLSLHLDRIFGRKKMKSILYPEVAEVVKNNLHVKAVVDKNISILEKHFDIKMTEGDIAYIVIYICASIEKLKQRTFDVNIVIVCNSGFGTSQLLKYKLEEHFAFNIKKILPAHNLEKNRDLLKGIDFIISTVYLDINFPYVRINPLLTERDIININTMLLQLETADMNLDSGNQHNQKMLLNKIKLICQPYNNLYESLVPVIDDYLNKENDFIYLNSLLTEDFVKVDVETYDWEDSIRKAAKILLDKSFITENYIEAMIDNYNENGPYFVIAPNFAMPHASIEAGTKELGMSLIRLKEPAIDNNMHLKAMFNLINLLKIKEFRNALDMANSSREIANLIKDFEKNII